MNKIVVYLPNDRFISGSLHIEDDNNDVIAGPWSVLGRSGKAVANSPDDYGITAPANPTRDPKAMLGDTPPGTYKIVAAVKSGMQASNPYLKSPQSYGSTGVVLLLGTGGDALTATQAGRTAFMIHGGDLHQNKLRPAAGCLRMSNENMEQLMTALFNLRLEHKSPSVCEINIGDTVFVYHPVNSTLPDDENIQNEVLYEPPAGLLNVNWSKMPLTDLLPNLPYNVDPTVSAGNNQTITLPVSSVTLSCQALDPDGNMLSYKWTQISGPPASITSPTSSSTTVTGLSEGSYVFEIAVLDDKGASTNDTVNVIVNKAIPPPHDRHDREIPHDREHHDRDPHDREPHDRSF